MFREAAQTPGRTRLPSAQVRPEQRGQYVLRLARPSMVWPESSTSL